MEEVIDYFGAFFLIYFVLSLLAILFFCTEIHLSESGKNHDSVCEVKPRRITMVFIPSVVISCWLMERP